MYVVKPLSECWRDCPTSENADLTSQFCDEWIQEADRKFLQSLGVKFPDTSA